VFVLLLKLLESREQAISRASVSVQPFAKLTVAVRGEAFGCKVFVVDLGS